MSKDLARTLICVALVYGAIEINRGWVSIRQTSAHVEQTVELSRQETERLKVFVATVKQTAH